MDTYDSTLSMFLLETDVTYSWLWGGSSGAIVQVTLHPLGDQVRHAHLQNLRILKTQMAAIRRGIEICVPCLHSPTPAGLVLSLTQSQHSLSSQEWLQECEQNSEIKLSVCPAMALHPNPGAPLLTALPSYLKT